MRYGGTFLALALSAVVAKADVITSGHSAFQVVDERALPQSPLTRVDRIVKFEDVVDGQKIVCFTVIGAGDEAPVTSGSAISCVPLGTRDR